MIKPQKRWKGPWRYAGLLLMGLGVLAALTNGALAFERLITVEKAQAAIFVSVLLLGLPGFVLHMVTVVCRKRGDGD